MISSKIRGRVIAGWIYVPGFLMILLGASIFLFPSFFPSIVAGFLILAGLALIQSFRSLRKTVIRIRTQLDVDDEQSLDLYPEDLFPRRVYTSHIN